MKKVLKLCVGKEPKQIMNAKQYRVFSEKFQEKVKPTLDALHNCYANSAKSANSHFIG